MKKSRLRLFLHQQAGTLKKEARPMSAKFKTGPVHEKEKEKIEHIGNWQNRVGWLSVDHKPDLVGCMTDNSEGFSPLSILLT
jgi:hypothetical protein